ncbi:MAG: DUF4332 domain-containing protein, partial [Candidatus Sericytochromatia bacterium]
LMLTACGSGSVTVSALKPEQIKSGVQSLQAVKSVDSDDLKPIKLEPISTETVQQQARLRTEAKSAKTVSDKSTPSAEDSARIRKLIADAQTKIAEEDRAHEQAGFSVKSAGHGEDVDIKLFLYHPKYGDKAKSWGIDNAAEFLEAAKSPWRRWTLKLKLEGLFAPKGFNQQVLFWAEQADLLRVTGISKDQAWLLVANGITSVPDLARRANIIEQAALVLNIKIMAFSYGMSAPSLDQFQNWVDEAQTLQPVLY